MLDSLVSSLIKAMIPKVGSYIGSQYTWQRDMKDDLTKLKATLVDIQIVVDVAERGQIVNQNQSILLRELKDAVYEADDVLDEFEYQDMEAQAKKARGPVSYIASSSLTFAKRLVGQNKLRNQLREVLGKLENINARAKGLIPVLQLEKTIPSEQVAVNPSRVTSSIISEERIFGRDKEKDEIVSLLLQQSTDEPESSNSKPFHVISIVGIGGVGKTTLAQLVYNDTRVSSKEHFTLHMWVCVSDRFDLFRLTKEMLVSASRNSEEQQDFKNLNFNDLQRELQIKLKSKRFLLVVDDVWMDEKHGDFENKQMWKKLLAPLKDGAKGSKILVTTRMEKVADMFDEKNLIFLKGLEKDKYWQFFTSCAFGNKNPDDHSELKQIAWKIAERLKGSPLAAKAVGSMLQSKFNIEKWNEILGKKVFDDINNLLKLSYEHLPDHLKNCFAYCSIFPKDWVFDRQKLAFLWMAQGYVQSGEGDNRTEENIGIDYFDELVSRSFFQIVDKDSSISYVMHDLIHDLAEHVSIDECFRIDGGEKRSIGQSIRHIGVVFNDDRDNIEEVVWSPLQKMSNRKNLRTLIFVNSYKRILIDPPSWFREVRSLRVLGFNRGFKGDIGHLVHLRYLDLGDTYDTWAESLSGLFHLKVVFSSYEKLSHCKSLAELSAFGKLTDIFVKRLDFFVEKKRGVRDLKDIKLRGGLRIKNLGNVHSEEEAAEAGLEHQEFIEKLTLWWGDLGAFERRIVRHDSEEKVLDALKPHPNLKYLEISDFGGSRWPSWLEINWLIHLQSIHLYGCKGLEVMPPLGHLPCLKNLYLWGMDSVERIGREFYGDGNHGVKGFPSLEELSFHDMPAWVEWSAPEFPVFPRLRKLTLFACPKLKQFPSFPSAIDEPVPARGMLPLITLQNLHINGCTELLLASIFPDEDEEEGGRGILPSSLAFLEIKRSGIRDRCLSRCLQGLSFLSHLEIEDCNGLTSLPSAEVLHCLTVLEEMFIQNCKELASLWGLHALPSLQKLELANCPKLKSPPEEDEEGRGILPPSLESLDIRQCGVTDRCLSRCLQGLSFLSHLKIQDCNGLTSLPSAEVLHRLTALQEMSIHYCKHLASFGGLHALPSLQKLELANCPKLESLPEEDEEGRGILPPSLESLDIEQCGVTDRCLSRCLQGLFSLSYLKIEDCNGLTSLPFAEVLHRLTALQEMSIHYCEDLASFGGLHALPSLQKFYVIGCPKLESLPEEGLPPSIKELKLYGCHPALERQMHKKEGPEWDKISRIRSLQLLG